MISPMSGTNGGDTISTSRKTFWSGSISAPPRNAGRRRLLPASAGRGFRRMRWVFHECSAAYQIGDFNGREFVTASKKQKTSMEHTSPLIPSITRRRAADPGGGNARLQLLPARSRPACKRRHHAAERGDVHLAHRPAFVSQSREGNRDAHLRAGRSSGSPPLRTFPPSSPASSPACSTSSSSGTRPGAGISNSRFGIASCSPSQRGLELGRRRPEFRKNYCYSQSTNG